MSTNNGASDGETVTLGSRENYWGGSEDPDEAYDVDEEEDDSQPDHGGIGRERWVAGSILRGAPETSLLCPECWTELTDPAHYVEPSRVELEDEEIEIRYSDHRKHRRCPSCAEISWGGILADVDAADFLEIVDRVLSALDIPTGRDDLREAAASRKEDGLSDEANLERLLLDLRYGVDDDLRGGAE